MEVTEVAVAMIEAVRVHTPHRGRELLAQGLPQPKRGRLRDPRGTEVFETRRARQLLSDQERL